MTDVLRTMLQRYRHYDVNAEGAPAIEEIDYMDFEDPADVPPAGGRFALVFVEPRLFAPIGGTLSPGDIRTRLIRLKGDLRAEGLFSRFVLAQVYAGPRHQDGRTLLAMREILREARGLYRHLEGAILIGSFPEAMLVRRWIWRTKRDVTAGGQTHKAAEHLRIVPEIVAHRADLILADLDGAWHNLYDQGPSQVEAIEALPAASMSGSWPENNQTFVSQVFHEFNETYEDFFLVDDADWTRLAAPQGELRLLIRKTQLHPELNPSDRSLPNPVARPNISVSRINPRNIAATPDAAVANWLDGAGQPQAFVSSNDVDTRPGSWIPDPQLERRLLVDYLDRNHRFRVGAFGNLPHRAAAVGHAFSGAGMLGYLNKAGSGLGQGIATENTTLVDYVDFLKQPATLRGLYAHADPWGTMFSDQYQTSALEQAAGGHSWRWRRQGTTYTPSLEQQEGKADLYLHRTLWANRVMANSGAALWVHGGCLANSPGGAASHPYDDRRYGGFQNAEGILFYLEGVAIIARAKVFYDLPAGFTTAIGATPRTSFGEGWRATFNVESGDAALAEKPASAKRVYNWSVLGDWTLRVKNRNGLGILRYADGLTSQAVHPNDAWIGRWNYSSNLNRVEAISDIDGDGKDELIVRSAWGISVLGHDGTRWRDLLVAPDDTWFGAWRFNASVNAGEDHVHGAGRLSSSGRGDLLVTSSWGIGVLTWNGQTLTSAIARPNGSRFGGWWFDARANRIERMADFDGDGRDEILVSSDWGIGMLKLVGGGLTSILMVADGTRFGGWVSNTADNRYHGFGNLTGLGGDDLIITSPWGIGLFTLSGNELDAWFTAPNGTSFGGWRWNSADNRLYAAGDIDGDGRQEIVVTSPWGMAILEPRGPRLEPIVIAANNTRFGEWRWNSADNQIVAAADVDGDGKAELIVTSPWGVGVLGLVGGSLIAKYLQSYPNRIGEWVSGAGDRWIGTGDFSGTVAHELLVQKPG
jgi:hypothetical protein